MVLSSPCALLLLAATVLPRLAHGALVINEILYDPEGPDRGAEWVEILNTGPWPATLEGVVLQAGDGAGPGRWKQAWAGAPGEWVDAGGYCVVGGPWEGRSPCSAGILELGNGPDGVRLVREGLELDRVGWGEFTEHEYYEGSPAATVSSGRSLARLEDGRDTDDNGADFAGAAPSPGRPNHPARDLAVRLLRPGPPVPFSPGGGEVHLVARLENRGSVAAPVEEIGLLVDGRPVSPDPARLSGSLAAGLAVDVDVSVPLPNDAGACRWTCSVHWSGDLMPENDRDTLHGWAGASPVSFSEIAPRPRPGGTEWIELECAAPGVAPGGWSVRDRGGATLTLRGGETVPPGARVVVARDSAAAFEAGIVTVAWDGRWPTLNDTAPKGGAADTLWLSDPSGLVTDWAVYGTTDEGQTWVRLANAPVGAGLESWIVADGPPGGTPGAPNSRSPSSLLLPAAGAGGESAAISLARDPGGLWIPVPPAGAGSSRALRILRLDGSTAGEFAPPSGAARPWARWDGRAPDGSACPAGVYLLETRLVDAEGRVRTTRRPVVVGR